MVAARGKTVDEAQKSNFGVFIGNHAARVPFRFLFSTHRRSIFESLDDDVGMPHAFPRYTSVYVHQHVIVEEFTKNGVYVL